MPWAVLQMVPSLRPTVARHPGFRGATLDGPPLHKFGQNNTISLGKN